jgi:DNA-binding HxlR family transcriptional regulator
MKLTGPACTEALNEVEEAGRRERTEGKAGGVRVERRVRR